MTTGQQRPLITQAEFDRRSAGFDRDLQRIHDDIAELRRGQARLDRRIDTTAKDLRQEFNARIDAVCDRLDAKIDAAIDRLNAKIDSARGR